MCGAPLQIAPPVINAKMAAASNLAPTLVLRAPSGAQAQAVIKLA